MASLYIELHITICICHRKLREDSESGEDSSATLQRLADMRAALRFGQDESHLRNAINTLPNGKGLVTFYGEGGGYKMGGGRVKFYPYEKKGGGVFSHAEGGAQNVLG